MVLIGDIINRPIHPSIINIINKYKLQNKVHFTGYINNSEIPKYLKGAKLLALARQTEKDNITKEIDNLQGQAPRDSASYQILNELKGLLSGGSE